MEKSVTVLRYLLSSYFAIAPGSCASCCSSCRTLWCNPYSNPTIDPAGVAQGLAEGPAESASTAGSENATVSSYAGTPAPSCASIPAPAPAPPSTENFFQYLITTYGATLKALEQSQTVQSQVGANQKPQEKPLKAKNPDIYFGKSHMDCYNFCQKWKDHFATARATGSNCIPFAATFFCEIISLHWTQ